ncbi:hypothetical protein [Ruminiclostridium papyrosolvens]|uniref:Uncharacterized protein n=1 Tax=Ruminiclostridium papyrosolvens C7 TaxID=1330534 RepID=U4R5P7_9FIRM|nr:hypothetical protein [Ruminiclostridium papyrosolvens]EPR13996.1 hypothetical protein L323_01670 [Ruminiclostridium papyrosolvens C7]
MARGKSGRIVLEVEQNIKNKLYVALAKNQTTLKDWFLETANSYIKDNSILDELLIAEKQDEYIIDKK